MPGAAIKGHPMKKQESKNTLAPLLASGPLLQQYAKAVAAQQRCHLTGTYNSLADAVALLETAAGTRSREEKQLAVQHTAYTMLCFTAAREWAETGARLDYAKDTGRRVKELPLAAALLDMMGSYGEVPRSTHAERAAAEVTYCCVYSKRTDDIARWTAELARQGCILVGLTRSLKNERKICHGNADA